MICGVHHSHVTIPSGGEAIARDFYCALLGLQEVEKPENLKAKGGLWLQLPNAQVHLGVEDGTDRRGTKAHVAYMVKNLEEVRTRLSERGYEPLDGLPIPGHVRFECRDPFGNRMEFIQRL